MLKSVLLLTLISSVSFAQLADKTEACYGAAVSVAANKIAKDSKTKKSILNDIGFVAEYCQYSGQNQMIECMNSKDVVQFDVAFDSSKHKQKNPNLSEMTYLFTTGTQGVDVYYELKFVKPETSRTCTYMKTSVWAEDTEEMFNPAQKGDKTRGEIELCVKTCLATYDQPSAEFKACIASCNK